MLVCSPVDSTGNLIWPCKDEYGYITTQFDDLVHHRFTTIRTIGRA